MHTQIQGGLHYKIGFKADVLLLATVYFAIFNEVAEVVRIEVGDKVTTPEQVKEIVHEIDLFLTESGATVAYVHADNFADALVDEFIFAGYTEDWTQSSDVMYKFLKE